MSCERCAQRDREPVHRAKLAERDERLDRVRQAEELLAFYEGSERVIDGDRFPGKKPTVEINAEEEGGDFQTILAHLRAALTGDGKDDEYPATHDLNDAAERGED